MYTAPYIIRQSIVHHSTSHHITSYRITSHHRPAGSTSHRTSLLTMQHITHHTAQHRARQLSGPAAVGRLTWVGDSSWPCGEAMLTGSALGEAAGRKCRPQCGHCTCVLAWSTHTRTRPASDTSQGTDTPRSDAAQTQNLTESRKFSTTSLLVSVPMSVFVLVHGLLVSWFLFRWPGDKFSSVSV